MEAMIGYSERAIALFRYSLTEYLDYFDMLAVGIQMYEQAGNSQSAAYCRQRLAAIPDMMAQILEDTSALAWKIDDKPDLTLPEKYQRMLETLT